MNRKTRLGDAAARTWTVVVRAPRVVEDEIVGRLAAEALGADVRPAGPEECEILVYVASEAEARRLREGVPAVFAAWGLDPRRGVARIEPVKDEGWVERYQASLRPFPLGGRFRVLPGGGEAGEERIGIRLVPGRAFGTGEHPTTRLCVDALERWVRPGSRWLDLGSGSGILSIVAVHCGARRVEARDIDPEAVEVAREVVAGNGLEERIGLEVGSTESLVGPPFDGVVANIAAEFFLGNADRLGPWVAAEGSVIAAGFLAQDAAGVGRALRRAGFRLVEERGEGEWRAIVASQGPAERGP